MSLIQHEKKPDAFSVDQEALVAVANSVELRPPVRYIRSTNPCRVKPITHKSDTCHFLAQRSALLAQGNEWLAQCQDNVTGWDIGSWCCWSDFPMGQHHKVVMCVYCHKLVPILI